MLYVIRLPFLLLPPAIFPSTLLSIILPTVVPWLAQLDDFVSPMSCQQMFPHTNCVSTFCENHCSGFTVASRHSLCLSRVLVCVCVC